MYIDDFYTPSTQFGFEPDSSGYIPDQNQTVYYSPRDLQFQNQIDSDATQQLGNFIAQQQTPAKKQSGYIAINKGDTLSKLAQQYGTTVENLAKLNGIRDINKIKAGDILRLTNNVTNKYRNSVRTTRIRKRIKNTNTPAQEEVTTTHTLPTAYVTAPKRNTNVGQKPRTKSISINKKNNTNNNYSQQVPTVQYTPESTKDYQNSIRKQNQRRNTKQESKPGSLFDVILNIGRSINQENRNKKRILEEYDRKHPRQTR